MSLSPSTKLGPYEILAPLGAGGMGEVYKAKDTRLDRTVAIKVLPSHVASNPEVRQRFEREARAVSSLNHLCIVKTGPPMKSRTCALLEFRAEGGETAPLCSAYSPSSSLSASAPSGRCVGAEPTS